MKQGTTPQMMSLHAMSDLVLLIAMNAELPDMFPRSSGIYSMGGHTIRVARSGIGRRKARRALERILAGSGTGKPDVIMTLGFCGGARNDLSVSDIILANRVRYRDQVIEIQNRYLDRICEKMAGQGFRTGTVQSFDTLVLSRRRVSKDATAVDMEAFALADTAGKYGIPLVVVKAVSDIVRETGGPAGLLRFCLSIKKNAEKAKSRLNRFMAEFVSRDFV